MSNSRKSNLDAKGMSPERTTIWAFFYDAAAHRRPGVSSSGRQADVA